jgi:DNA-binding response OmpR family regulator
MCRVLVIDDEQMVRDMLQHALNRSEFSVDTAENAVGGLEKFNNNRFDLVITDVRLPGMDGNEVARQIKQSSHQRTPVMGISGTPWLVKNGEFDDVLLKPFTLQALIDKARALTEQRRDNYLDGR